MTLFCVLLKFKVQVIKDCNEINFVGSVFLKCFFIIVLSLVARPLSELFFFLLFSMWFYYIHSIVVMIASFNSRYFLMRYCICYCKFNVIQQIICVSLSHIHIRWCFYGSLCAVVVKIIILHIKSTSTTSSHFPLILIYI